MLLQLIISVDDYSQKNNTKGTYASNNSKIDQGHYVAQNYKNQEQQGPVTCCYHDLNLDCPK